MNVKKIVIIASEFPPQPGGMGNHAYHLAKYFHDSNIETAVITNFRNQKEDIAFDRKQLFNVYRIKRNLFTKINRIWKAFYIAKRNDTIIYSGKYSLWTGGLLQIIFPRKKHIAVLHGSEIRAGGNFSQALTQWSLKRFDAIIAVSRFTRDIAIKFNPNLKIDVINNGFTIPLNSTEIRMGKIDASPVLVTVGNLTKRKGQHNVIRALPILQKLYPRIHYHCVGIPTDKQLLTKLAASLHVEKNVTFHGALASKDATSILKQSDVFCMLSDVLENGDFEGFGIAILEANALGLPAIGSNNSGIADAISMGFSGELVNSKDSQEILTALSKIMDDYHEYSANAISWSTNFSWDLIGKKYFEIIER